MIFQNLEILSKFVNIGTVFFTGEGGGGSLSDAQRTLLSGQSLNAIAKLIKYLHKLVNINIKHKLDLFDK